MTADGGSAHIIVGVDGSEDAARALEFAIDEARLRHASLLVVYAYPTLGAPLTGSTGSDYYTQIEEKAKEFLAGIAAAAPPSGDLDVEWHAVPGSPAGVLIDRSRGATMMVVGSRGLGGFHELAVGSVSTQCVHHAHCPVLVLRLHAEDS